MASNSNVADDFYYQWVQGPFLIGCENLETAEKQLRELVASGSDVGVLETEISIKSEILDADPIQHQRLSTEQESKERGRRETGQWPTDVKPRTF